MNPVLSSRQSKALEVGCPYCGQQKGKKCITKGKLNAVPHSARLVQASEVAEFKSKKHQRRAVNHGFVDAGEKLTFSA